MRDRGGSTTEQSGTEQTAVFDLLSDETRLAIVTELDRARRDGEADGLRFSTLRGRVGAADSGRFNYHLKKLRGTLVRKDGDHYVLTPTGVRMAATVTD
ncbi:MAG: hypothetical protein ABEI99_00435 [Halobaculum sp.]